MGEKSGVLRLVLIAGFALLIFFMGPKLGLAAVRGEWERAHATVLKRCQSVKKA